MSEEQTVTYELEGEIALVGLNRPDKRNCFNPTVSKQLLDAVVRAGEEAKCGIIFGHGDNFCAGLDLAWAAENWREGRSQRLPFQFNRNSFQEAMARGNIPFIAALHGATLGGGLETAACAHIRVADETTFFGLPEGTRGIFIGGGGSVRVARLRPHAGHDADGPYAQSRRKRTLRHRAIRRAERAGARQGEGAGRENLQERAAFQFRHHQQPAAAPGHVLR
jgi:enoyl-CoA hydratase/carnithine racemase